MFRVERNQLFFCVVSQFKLKCCLTYYIVDENQPQCSANKQKEGKTWNIVKHIKMYKSFERKKKNIFLFKDGINYRKL